MATGDMLRGAVRTWARLSLRSAEAVTRTSTSLLRRADLGIGAWRLTPEGYRELRAAAIARMRELLDVPDPAALVTERIRHDREPSVPDDDQVREAFAQLLDESRLVTEARRPHPAFLAIVGEMCPDEARILRLFCHEGAQPSVVVVAAPWIGKGARTLAEHLSLIGDRSGCLEPDRAPLYVTNLHRLGLLTVDETELVGHADYELIEVGKRATELRDRIEHERNQRARMHRCTLRLSPLGEEFCTLVMPDDDGLGST